jgi:SAM-dependent methyltransferase
MSDDEWERACVRAWRELTGKRGGDALSERELRDVGASARRLSEGLIGDRALAGGDYMSDASLLGAYLLYFWPRSYAQASAVFGEVGGLEGRVLDVGGGPGPMAAAALDAGASRVHVVDGSARALEAARALMGARATTARRDLERVGASDEEGFGAIVVGHAVNELWGGQRGGVSRRVGLCEDLLGRLAPGGLLVVIEPALKETSRGLLEVRDALLERGARVRAPCLFAGACPALERARDWCHAERAWSPWGVTEAIAREAGRDVTRHRMTYVVFEAPGAAGRLGPPDDAFRIVSAPLHSKGQHRFMGCGPRGRHGLTLLTRHANGSRASFGELERYDVVRLVGELEPKGDGLRVGPEVEVEPLAGAFEPLDFADE